MLCIISDSLICFSYIAVSVNPNCYTIIDKSMIICQYRLIGNVPHALATSTTMVQTYR